MSRSVLIRFFCNFNVLFCVPVPRTPARAFIFPLTHRPVACGLVSSKEVQDYMMGKYTRLVLSSNYTGFTNAPHACMCRLFIQPTVLCRKWTGLESLGAVIN